MQKIVEGVRRFQTEVFPENRALFEELANKQQKPQALFITCSDSRINPNLITQTEPGELFLVRNAGNIIPPYGPSSGGEGATVEYAVGVLGIQNIIVCGHSRCGAMHNLLRFDNPSDMPAVASWFKHAEATRRIVREKYAGRFDGELERVTIEENVLVQIDNLRTHPCVAAGLAGGRLRVYGWVYHIESGEVHSYDGKLGQFVPLTAELPIPIPSPHRLSMVSACA